jgi:hypothetical protein
MGRRSYTALAVFAAFMAAVSSASAAASAPLIEGQYFAKARLNILHAGWRPVVTHLKFTDGSEQRLAGDAGAMTSAGWVEVEYCSGTGRNYCFFNYSRRGHCLRVLTRGEYYPEDRSPTVLSWTSECPKPQDD